MGYEPVVTPHIGRLDLYRTSGHYPYYSDSQFPPMLEGQSGPALPEGEAPEARTHTETPAEAEEHGYLLKPMNCPHHTQIYAHKPRSYRDLPVRLAEFGTVYRYEQSGELGGLTRVRGFTQDDAHVFCRPDQVKDEFKSAIALTMTVLRALDFQDYTAQVSLRDPANTEKYIGDDATWDAAEQAIREAAAEMGLVTTEVEGEAAFYGAKLDFMVKDALGRSVAAGHGPAGLQPPRALRPHLHGRARREAAAGHDPPRAVRLARALHRRDDRAHGRQLPAVARAAPDQGPPDHGRPERLRRGARGRDEGGRLPRRDRTCARRR